MNSMTTKFASPYEAGYHAGRYGANTYNCHFGWFNKPENTKEWERGNRDGSNERERLNPNRQDPQFNKK